MRDQDKLKQLLSKIKYQHLKDTNDLRSDEENCRRCFINFKCSIRY